MCGAGIGDLHGERCPRLGRAGAATRGPHARPWRRVVAGVALALLAPVAAAAWALTALLTALASWTAAGAVAIDAPWQRERARMGGSRTLVVVVVLLGIDLAAGITWWLVAR